MSSSLISIKNRIAEPGQRRFLCGAFFVMVVVVRPRRLVAASYSLCAVCGLACSIEWSFRQKNKIMISQNPKDDDIVRVWVSDPLRVLDALCRHGCQCWLRRMSLHQLTLCIVSAVW